MGGASKVYIIGSGHMNKMAVMLIYGKIFINLLVQNPNIYYIETWHASSGTYDLQV